MTAPWLITKPTSPSQWDDEFETDTLDPKWTRNTSGPTFLSVDSFDPYTTSAESVHRESLHRARPSWLMVQPASPGGTATALYEQDLTGIPTNCFIWARVSANVRRASITDADGEVTIRVYNNAAGEGPNYFHVSVDTFTNIIEGFCRQQLSSVGTNKGLIRNYFGEAFPVEYIGMQKVGATYHGWAAPASGNWVWLGSTTFAADNFDHVKFYMNNAVVSAPGKMIVGADFFRVTPGKGPP